MARHRTALLPQIRGCKLFVFSSQRKEAKKKRCSSHEVTFTDCPQKITRRLPPAEESGKPRLRDIQSQRIFIYVYIYEEILYRKGSWESMSGSVRLNPCVCVCVCVCDGKHYSRLVCPWSCVALCSCRQLLCITGSGWASVLNTQSSSGRRSSSENSRYRYLWSHTDGVNKTSPSKHCINTNMPVCFCMLVCF